MMRGEVWWATLPAPWGRRPVLLVARDQAYQVLTWVMAAPLTTTIWTIPTAVPLDSSSDGVPHPCVVSLDNIQAVRKDWLEAMIARLSAAKMREVDAAIRFALDVRR